MNRIPQSNGGGNKKTSPKATDNSRYAGSFVKRNRRRIIVGREDKSALNTHGPLGSTATMDTVLTKYILKAGIIVKSGEHYGMHSLRKTLATNMLVSGTALPVITQTLGHQDPKSTELYLSTDIQGLKQCALDPDEEYGEASV